jgi:hypothetical protein
MENVKEIQELLGMVGRKQPDGGQEAAKYAYFQARSESKYIMQRRHSLSYIAHSKPPSSLAFLVLIYLALPDSP